MWLNLSRGSELAGRRLYSITTYPRLLYIYFHEGRFPINHSTLYLLELKKLKSVRIRNTYKSGE